MRSPTTAVAALCAAAIVSAPAMAQADTGTFTNPAAITMPVVGEATTYPSVLTALDLAGPIVDVNVTLSGVAHTFPDDFDILLVSPSGEGVVLMSDACGDPNVAGVPWTFDDQAAEVMPDESVTCDNLVYRPSDYLDSPDTWPPAFPGPHGSALADFNGENPNGIWRLYVRDDLIGDSGNIASGWSLTITTGAADTLIPADDNGGFGPANPYPRSQAVSGQAGVIADVNVRLSALSHEHPDDLDVLLEGPGGRRVLLMSDSCGHFDYHDVTLTWDDEAPGPMEDIPAVAGTCNAGAFRPTNHGGPPEDLLAPAPPGPYASTLSAFDGLDPNGTWNLYFSDDAGGDVGFMLNPFALEIATRPRANVRVAGAGQIAEGGSASFTLTRSGPPGPYGPATVDVQTVGGSAGAGDFGGSQTVSFADGETEKTVSVAALADGAAERTETFAVRLANATGDADASGQQPLQVAIPGDDVKPAVRVLSRSLVLGARRQVSLALRGPAGEAATVRVVLRAKLPRRRGKPKSTVVARKRVSLRPNRRTVVKLKLSRKAAARLRAQGRLPVSLTLTATDAAGNRSSLKRNLSAKPKAR
jgi:subtilisin-like proprotein convertase family protein